MSSLQWICRRCARTLRAPQDQFTIQKRRLHDRWLQRQYAGELEWKNQADEIRKGGRKGMLAVLEERGFVHQTTGSRDELDRLLTAKRVGAYVGVDPTAPSLHLGHMVPLMSLFWMYLHGFQAVTLLGGSTASVGDPTGRKTAREKMDTLERKVNIVRMHKQLQLLWVHVEELGRRHGFEWRPTWKRALLNNNFWLNKVSVQEVLKLMGSGLRMGALLNRDSVKLRMESGEGMSLSEFCYPLLQAWDWWEMYKSTGVQVQIGGADQFGNILTGAEGVKHVLKTHPHQDFRINEDSEHWEPMGMTTPLLTSASGEKFGKSAGNAVWLDRELTGPFELYAHLLSTPDDDVERHLKLFTFLPLESIATLMAEQRANPEKRAAQHTLAREFLHLAHGSTAAKETAELHRARAAERKTISISGLQLRQRTREVEAAVKRSSVPDYMRGPPAGRMLAGVGKVPETVSVARRFLEENSFPSVLQHVGLVGSRSEGHRLITNKGAYVACDTASDALDADHLTWRPITSPIKGAPAGHVKWEGENGLLVLRSGKWNVRIVRVFSDPDAAIPDARTDEVVR